MGEEGKASKAERAPENANGARYVLRCIFVSVCDFFSWPKWLPMYMLVSKIASLTSLQSMQGGLNKFNYLFRVQAKGEAHCCGQIVLGELGCLHVVGMVKDSD